MTLNSGELAWCKSMAWEEFKKIEQSFIGVLRHMVEVGGADAHARVQPLEKFRISKIV